MKKITILALMLLTQIAFSQGLTENQKLAATCKVWGFLKYYHPKVAHGDFDWDKQLIDVLPKIEQAKNNFEFSLIIETWIDNLGEIPKIAPISINKKIEYFDKNFDLSWFKNNLFSANLTKKLKFIEDNRFQGKQYYVNQYDESNIFVTNDKKTNLDYTKKELRLLSFFAYWNVVEYFFPYKYIMDTKWDVSLTELMPLIVNAKNTKEFCIAMEKVTVRLNDSHVYFYSYKREIPRDSMKTFYARPKIIDEKLVLIKIYNDSLAQADDVKVGDVITHINNKTIKEIIAEKREFISASNNAYYLDYLTQGLFPSSSKTIKLGFLIKGKTVTKKINLVDMHEAFLNNYRKKVKPEKFKLLDNNIGYVNIGEINVKSVPEMIEKLTNTKAIIFDIRNYPKETIEEITDFIFPSEKPYAIYTKPDLSYPGKYKWSEIEKIGKENKNNYKGKVIVLLNEKSISQSEWMAMMFQTLDNATIIGSQTAGADGNVTEIDFVSDFHTRFTGIGVYYPDRRETQRIGIVPDIEVKPTIKGIQEGRDEVLDRALKFIETGK